jgi:hypothetical protein
MILEVRQGTMFVDGQAQPGLHGVLVKAATGERIAFARYANLDTGQWQAWAATPDGRLMALPARLVGGTCPLRFVESYAPPVQTSALPDGAGDRQQGQALQQRFRRITERIVLIRGLSCEQPGCGRDAAYRVADEMLLPAEAGAQGQQFERAMTVHSHRYCERHYRQPRQLAPNGDTVRTVEVATCPGWTSK